jgi:hypothetical protein
MLSLIGEDACYILEPVVELLAGMPKRQARKALRAAARRSLRLAAQDRGLLLREAEKEAGEVSRELVQVKQVNKAVERLRAYRAA